MLRTHRSSKSNYLVRLKILASVYHRWRDRRGEGERREGREVLGRGSVMLASGGRVGVHSGYGENGPRHRTVLAHGTFYRPSRTIFKDGVI